MNMTLRFIEEVGARPHRRRHGRLALAATALLLTTGLAACGSGDAGDSASNDSGSNTNSLNTMSEADLYQQAKQEGQVTVYTPLNSDAMSAIGKAFNATYPGIQVKAVTLNVDDLVARMGTEQQGGKYVPDVITEDGIHTSQLVSVHALEPYTPQTMPTMPSSLTDVPQGYQSVAFVTTRAIAYNPQTLKKKGITAPTSLADLTKPEWKGNFSMTAHGADLYTSLIAADGQQKAKDLLDKLGANKPQLVESNSQAITQVQSGEPAATISYGTYAAPAKASNPATLDFVNLNPLLTVPYFQTLAKNAPDPAAARLFINWWGGKDGQNAMIKASGFTSVRDDVSNDPTIWDPTKWPPVFAPMLSMDEYNQKLSEYSQALGVH
jgi:iron(III) transport system substrate-binding protein